MIWFLGISIAILIVGGIAGKLLTPGNRMVVYDPDDTDYL